MSLEECKCDCPYLKQHYLRPHNVYGATASAQSSRSQWVNVLDRNVYYNPAKTFNKDSI